MFIVTKHPWLKMIVRFVMVIQVQWVDSNIVRMDFRVVSSSIWRKNRDRFGDRELEGPRCKDERDSISRNVFGKLEQSSFVVLVSWDWKYLDFIRGQAFGIEMCCVVWADVQQRALISRNFVGVRRFDEIFPFSFRRSSFQCFRQWDHDSVTFTGLQRRRFDEFFLFSFSFSPATRWVALYRQTSHLTGFFGVRHRFDEIFLFWKRSKVVRHDVIFLFWKRGKQSFGTHSGLLASIRAQSRTGKESLRSYSGW